MLFRESTHEYYNKEDKYDSVTTYLSSFKKKQDWDKIIESYLKKHNTPKKLLNDLASKWKITPEQAYKKWGNIEVTEDFIKGVWKDKSKRATDAGTYLHELMELKDSVKENTIYNPIKDDLKTFNSLLDIQAGFTYLELGLYSHKYRLAGQADKVIITGEKKSIIEDYKTNLDRSKLDPEGVAYFNRELKRKEIRTLDTPLSHITDNDYWKYALQLSMYAYLLERYGIENERLTLFFIHTKFINLNDLKEENTCIFTEEEFGRARIIDTENFEGGIESIEVPYLKKEIKAILKVRQLQLQSELIN